MPNNLPMQLTSFVGREKELAEALRLLERTRILTLTGPGGTGKTRLALQIAAEVADEFRDGAFFVDLGLDQRSRGGALPGPDLDRPASAGPRSGPGA